MKKDFWTFLQRLFPFVGLIAIIIIFSFINRGNMWSSNNILTVVSIFIPLCLGGGGMVFVSAQGSSDLSVGSLVALCGTIAGIASMTLGVWAFVIVSVAVGMGVGILNGIIVSKGKVPSLMVTLAMLIALRALVSYITNGAVFFVDSSIIALNNIQTKLPIFLVVIAIMWYLFEFTKIGFFSRCMGENQVVGKFSGISIAKFQILAFMLSGAMAGMIGIFTVGSIGGISPTMGNFLELQIMIAIFVGGVPVSGGAGARFYKVVVGALMLSILQNGLTVSRVSAEMSELIQGIILLLVVFFGLFVRQKYIQHEIKRGAQ